MKRTLEQQIRQVMAGEALEYGTDKARDTYAKDTPGQTPGLEHDPVQHQHKPNLALDGVPHQGGELTKPNFEKDAGMGKVAEAKEMEVKNCGCDKDPCETYGSAEEQMNERNTAVKELGKTKAVFKVGKPKPIPGHPDYKGPQNPTPKAKLNDSPGNMKKEEAELDEAGRWDQTSQGRAYRKLSPEEKSRMAKKNAVKKAAARMKGKVTGGKQGIGKLRSVYKGTRLQRNDVMSDLLADLEMAYLGEAMSDSERKQAAAKIFRMHQAKQAAKQASTALGKKSDPAAKAARRDSSGYKTSDDSHLDSKPSKPEPKRGRGQSDLPHIVSQLRGVVDTKDGKPSAVKFKDGTTKSVNPKHASAWLKKHDSAKPNEKLAMYKSHDSHKSFQSHVGEEVETVNELSGKTLSNYIQKSANPVKKNSAVNLASRGGYKLGSSDIHDLDAGEKEDKKAYNRGQGMQRAAIKLQKKMYAKKDESYNPVLEAMKNVYGEDAISESEAYYDMKRAEKHASNDGHDFHKLPEYDRGADKPHKEKYRAMAQKNKHQDYRNLKNEATADQVTQARYRDKSDNPHTMAYLGRQKKGPALKTYKPIPGKNVDSDKGKMAVIKKQIARRPAQYGVDGKHDPIYPANKATVQKQGQRQKSKETAGTYKD